MRHPTLPRLSAEPGVTLVELMIALVILSFGVLAVAQLFPAATRDQMQARMTASAGYYAQEKVEQLNGEDWSSGALSVGRHPASGYDGLGSAGQWQRFYEVSAMPSPLDNLKKVTVTVQWTFRGTRSVSTTTYLRR